LRSAVAGLDLGICADEADESESVEIHVFSCSARVSWGTRKRVATAPKARSCFSGGTRMGEPEPGGRRGRSRSFEVRRARELARSCAQDQRTE
jgi:hypothetical protein